MIQSSKKFWYTFMYSQSIALMQHIFWYITAASMHSASPGSGKSCCSMEEGHEHSSAMVRVYTDYNPTKSEMLQIKVL